MRHRGTREHNPGLAKRRGVTAADVDPRELGIGTEHELEHTTDRRRARQIALDHLAEDPRYYTHLTACEKRYATNAARFWVWALSKGSDEPLASEGPWGPYPIANAKYFARIGAAEGKHDRIVTRGLDGEDFEVLRRYQAGTGERLI